MDQHAEQFWALLRDSQLVGPARLNHWRSQLALVPDLGTSTDARTVAEWLISQRVLSRYQAQLLLSGRSGPFNFGPYRVYEKTRDGAYRALHIPSQHPVQLRFAPRDAQKNQIIWDRLRRLGEAHMAISSPVVARCYHLVEDGEFRYAVLEDSAATSLRHIFSGGKSASLAATQICHIIMDIAVALQELHRHGLSHGPWQPSDVRLDRSCHAMLMHNPFASGMLPAWSSDDSIWDIHSDYAAPELARNDQPFDVLTDIYALGCLAFQLFEGEVPFRGGAIVVKLAAHANQRPKPFSRDLSTALVELIHSMMGKSRELRIAQASDVVEMIAEVPEFKASARRPHPVPATWGRYEQFLGSLPAPQQQHEQALPATSTETDHESNVGSPSQPMLVSAEPRRHRRRETWSWWSIAVATGSIVLCVGSALLLRNGTKDSDVPTANRSVPQATPTADSQTNGTSRAVTNEETSSAETTAAAVNNGSAVEVVVDDGETLWASPTTGEPIDLRFMPQGSQLILSFRPAEILSHEEGRRSLESLGPLLAEQQRAWEMTTGIPWAEIDSMQIAIVPGTDNRLDHVTAIRLQEGRHSDHWLEQLQSEPSPNGNKYRQGDRLIWLPTTAEPGLIVTGPEGLIEAIVEVDGAAPALRRDLEKLHLFTDRERWFNLLVAPNFLTGDGRNLFSGKYDRLRDIVREVARDELQGLVLSIDWSSDDGLYMELRLRPRLDVRAKDLAERMRQLVSQLPQQIESYVGQLPSVDPYWRRLALRVDSMFQLAAQYTRVVHQKDHVAINLVLPPESPHNLLLASELMLVSNSGRLVEQKQSDTDTIKSLEQLLANPITFSVPQESLEFAVQGLATSVNENTRGLGFQLEIRIAGNDLEADGITRNQQIRNFTRQDAPLADVLTGLVMQANPVTTVRSPAEADQKLIWVALPDTSGPTRTILITTRAAAEREGYPLPQVFLVP